TCGDFAQQHRRIFGSNYVLGCGTRDRRKCTVHKLQRHQRCGETRKHFTSSAVLRLFRARRVCPSWRVAASGSAQMKPEDRTTIFVAGGRDMAEHTDQFSRRKLLLELSDLAGLTETSAPSQFAKAKALIVAESPGKYGVFSDVFERVAPWAVAEGIALAYFLNAPADLNRVAAMMDHKSYLKQRVGGPTWVYYSENIQDLAEKLRRHNPGPGTGSAEIVSFGKKFELHDAHRKLLKRAFWDASDIAVEKLPGGASSTGAY